MHEVEFGTGMHVIAGFGEPGKPFLQSIREIADCGLKHLLLMCWEPNPPVDSSGNAPQAFINFFDSDPVALRRVISSHGLRVSCTYPGFGLFDLVDTKATIDKLKRYRDFSWDLGCHVMIHPTSAAKSPTAPLDEDKQRDIRAVAEIMDAVTSDKPGEIFKMAIDIHYNSTVETVADCEYFIKQSRNKNSGFCLNMGHLTTSGEKGWELIEKYPERIHVMAWKDHVTRENREKPVFSVELGTGDTPFQKYVESWRKVKVDAIQMIAFEEVPHEERAAILKRSVGYMNRLVTG